MSLASHRRWPWRVASILVVLVGLYVVATFTFVMWFALGMRAFDGHEPRLGHWVLLGTVDLAALAFLAWGANVLWRRSTT